LSKDDFQANVCLNYGGRDEIVRAARQFAEDCVKGIQNPWDLDEEEFSFYLDSRGIPDPELIIRPSGEMRISNFLLWQCAYSEFYITDTLWPDFDEAELDRAITAYQKRDRRFGGVKT
ncbi:MAG: di-trans,poly-cis-decaprenylcistransferase, partial [Oscillibacter sp.]|nr:di-trans,poly-cis-decaprenylcistransferase [Oscillibacter sp.]